MTAIPAGFLSNVCFFSTQRSVEVVEYILTFWAETVVETAHVIAKNAVIVFNFIIVFILIRIRNRPFTDGFLFLSYQLVTSTHSPL